MCWRTATATSCTSRVIVVDERTVITGLYNFTSSTEENNDENLVIVNDPALAPASCSGFLRVKQISPGASCRTCRSVWHWLSMS
jgi:phosphatidylserine/phosphatidylglycerophosphate/cardiolipin synthase-like enzyme